MDNNFSKNLKYLRLQSGITQEELGKKLNKDYTTIGKWENGSRSPVMEDVIKVADYFNTSLQEIVGSNLSAQKSSLSKLDNKYKNILKEKGLIDETVTEDDAKKLIDFAIANKDFIIDKKNEKE